MGYLAVIEIALSRVLSIVIVKHHRKDTENEHIKRNTISGDTRYFYTDSLILIF